MQYGLQGGGDGRLITSTYDAVNRLSTLSEGTRTTTYGYDLNGNILSKTLPNGEVVSKTYDGLNRLFTEKGISPQGPLYNHLSLCDAVGNLRFSSEMSAGVPTRSMVLDYDQANRLTNEKVYNPNNQLTSTTVHGYDNANNRISKTVGGVVTTYAYNNLNQLTDWSDTAGASASYDYDFNGNRSTRTVAGVADTYAYDLENRLVSLTKNTSGGRGSYGYVYDYRTRRVARTESASTTNLVFSGGTSVQEYTANTLSVDYVRGSDWGGGVGGILYSMRSNTPSFAHYNRRGDVTARTDTAGVLTYQASYQADGKRTQEFGATEDRQRANTKDEDPTGLLNEGMRYRDLETLTFLTADPAGFVDGPNLYAYVKQNPWTMFDPDGLEAWGGYEPNFIQKLYGAFSPNYEQAKSREAFHFSITGKELPSPSSFNRGEADASYIKSYENLGDKINDPSAVSQLQGNHQGEANNILMRQGSVAATKLAEAQPAFDAIEAFAVMAPAAIQLKAEFSASKNLIQQISQIETVKVSSWAGAGINPDLNPGRWVVKGEATKLNFFKTGLWGPKTSTKFPFLEMPKGPFKSITDKVSASSLISPKASLSEPFAPIKKLWGQYKISDKE